MKVAVRYFSRGGNVRLMAEAVARGAGVEALSIDEPGAQISEPVDLLFIGGALYAFALDRRLEDYIAELDGDLIGEVICFGSSLLTRRPVLLIQDRFKAKGVKICKQAFYSRGKPNDDLIGVIEYFGNQEVTRDRSLDALPPHMIFKRSQELKEQREAEAAAAKAASQGSDEES